MKGFKAFCVSASLIGIAIFLTIIAIFDIKTEMKKYEVIIEDAVWLNNEIDRKENNEQ